MSTLISPLKSKVFKAMTYIPHPPCQNCTAIKLYPSISTYLFLGLKPGMAARYVCIVVMEGEDASRADGDDCEAGTRTTLEAAKQCEAIH